MWQSSQVILHFLELSCLVDFDSNGLTFMKTFQSASDLNRNEEMTRTEQDEVSMLTVEQNQLKDKLQELQEKKEQMDELLQELNMMRDQKYLLGTVMDNYC